MSPYAFKREIFDNVWYDVSPSSQSFEDGGSGAAFVHFIPDGDGCEMACDGGGIFMRGTTSGECEGHEEDVVVWEVFPLLGIFELVLHDGFEYVEIHHSVTFEFLWCGVWFCACSNSWQPFFLVNDPYGVFVFLCDRQVAGHGGRINVWFIPFAEFPRAVIAQELGDFPEFIVHAVSQCLGDVVADTFEGFVKCALREEKVLFAFVEKDLQDVVRCCQMA